MVSLNLFLATSSLQGHFDEFWAIKKLQRSVNKRVLKRIFKIQMW